MIGRIVQYAKHRLLPLAHGQTAHGIAIEADGGQSLGTFAPQMFGYTPLLDAEQTHVPAGRRKRP